MEKGSQLNWTFLQCCKNVCSDNAQKYEKSHNQKYCSILFKLHTQALSVTIEINWKVHIIADPFSHPHSPLSRNWPLYVTLTSRCSFHLGRKK